ncbi:hypothetical protein GQ53DRAFT_801513 [Thozetella sp. PMI_491]|nr:hypothetical protein GQ53DRAFT_801513 [Thozetella sp. PMI_491]
MVFYTGPLPQGLGISRFLHTRRPRDSQTFLGVSLPTSCAPQSRRLSFTFDPFVSSASPFPLAFTMKTFASVLFLFAATASLVAAAPGPMITPAPMMPRQNAAANDGSKGIAAADLAQEAVDLAAAGDIGAQTNAAQFSAIDAKASAKEAADVKTAIDAVASASADAAAGKAAAASKAAADKAKAAADKAKAAKAAADKAKAAKAAGAKGNAAKAKNN